ncbi:ATP-binding protein [Actinoplanes sp. NPDC049802]|uniref:ATP-binding protein n=1 Tax=Actinoplanes sp. NPDC049802 TaxID=3154742 RepID=UPI0033C10D1D
MTYRRSLARTGLFAAAYLAATVTGRLTVLPGSDMSMVWPAAGVGVVWFCAQRKAPLRWLDVAALAVITMVVNMATGATAAVAALFVVTNLVQIGTFLALIDRWWPTLWTAGPRPMRGPRDLWALLGAAFGATVAGAVIGPTSIWLLTGRHSWPATVVWLARNTASILLIGSAGLYAAHLLARYRARHGTLRSWWRGCRATLAATPRRRAAEYSALTVCSLAAYLTGFSYTGSLPIAFTLIAVTVWAATRLATPFVVAHDLLVGLIAIGFTLYGSGPFATIADFTTRAFVAQLFVVIVAVVGMALATGRDERTALIAELAAEKDLLRAIFDSTADGLAVIDADNRVVLRNPAAVRLLGGFTKPGDKVAGSAHYGVFDLDGSPVPDDRMVHARALAGEDVPPTDLLIRNPAVPEGRIITARAATLVGQDGRRSAVVLIHDVTAERRQRDELASFAGVVAHDLLNPVTAVQGFAEIAAESVARMPGHPAAAEAEDALLRVSRAADRMRSLIDGLLANTTARDATVAAVPVDLGAIVSEVTVARLDAAIGAGQPAPRFTVGDLPPVQADPVLLRQLLDNLIGNAVKYTAKDVIPALTVTATVCDGLVRVCVADNGIGIPAGQHDEIFGDFHRAHRTAGYAGTGLGLGICKRIVERHGGTITASDNPGGGSRFVFTVPAAQTAQDREPAPDSAQLR